MVKSIKYFLLCASVVCALIGCTSKQDIAKQKQANAELSKEKHAQQEARVELMEKIERLEASVQQWQAVQPSVTRLVAIEAELNGLISQLNAIIDAAEKEHEVQKAPLEAQKSKVGKKTTAVQQTDKFYALQLISVTTVKGVKKSWDEVYQKNLQLLSTYQPIIEKVEIKGALYYRVKVGQFASKSAASELCSKLKQQQTACLVSTYSGQTLQQFTMQNQ